MADTALRIERRERVVILENQDPPRNRMTFEYMDGLEHAIVAIRADPGVRAVVITAAGNKHFSVGAGYALASRLNVNGTNDRLALDLTQKGPLVGVQFSF